MTRSNYASLILCLLTGVASAAEVATTPDSDVCNIDSISQRLIDSDAYYEFVQTKTVAALSRPLNSSGVIWLSPNGELVWQLGTPIKSTTVITAIGAKEYNRRDELQPSMDNAVASDMSFVFLNVLGGNFIALAELFSQSVNCDEGQWTLDLIPIKEPFINLLTVLSVSGGASLQRVRYEEARGDNTEISLTPSSRPDDSLEAYLDD